MNNDYEREKIKRLIESFSLAVYTNALGEMGKLNSPKLTAELSEESKMSREYLEHHPSIETGITEQDMLLLQIDMALDAGDMELFMQLTNELKMGWRVMVFPYMVPVYGLLVKVYTPEFDSLPEQYQIPVAEYLVGHVEKEK